MRQLFRRSPEGEEHCTVFVICSTQLIFPQFPAVPDPIQNRQVLLLCGCEILLHPEKTVWVIPMLPLIADPDQHQNEDGGEISRLQEKNFTA